MKPRLYQDPWIILWDINENDKNENEIICMGCFRTFSSKGSCISFVKLHKTEVTTVWPTYRGEVYLRNTHTCSCAGLSEVRSHGDRSRCKTRVCLGRSECRVDLRHLQGPNTHLCLVMTKWLIIMGDGSAVRRGKRWEGEQRRSVT